MKFSAWITSHCFIALLVSFLAPSVHVLHHQHEGGSHASDCNKSVSKCDSHGHKEEVLKETNHEEAVLAKIENGSQSESGCSFCELLKVREDTFSPTYKNIEPQIKLFLSHYNKRYIETPSSDIITYYDARAGPILS